MPTVVSEMPKRTIKYPKKRQWRTDAWLDAHLDGQCWRFVQSADFRESVKLFKKKMKAAAKERGLTLRIVEKREMINTHYKPVVYMKAVSHNGQPTNNTEERALKIVDGPVPLPTTPVPWIPVA